jgi:signal transduction histidine kinase
MEIVSNNPKRPYSSGTLAERISCNLPVKPIFAWLKCRRNIVDRCKRSYQQVKSRYLNLIESVFIAIVIFIMAMMTRPMMNNIIFSVMGIVVIAVIGNNLRRSRKHIAALIKLNGQISGQNDYIQKAVNALKQQRAEHTQLMMQQMAHDLRNPIGSIVTAVEIMLDETDRPDQDRIILGMIGTCAQNALQLVSGLLENMPKREGPEEFQADLCGLLNYCVDILNYKAKAKEQYIDLRATAITIRVNQEQLWRVITNLLDNAIKFSPAGARIHVVLQELPGRVLITVEDHGIGIPAAIADKIFDIPAGAGRPGTAGEKSHGLGLAISKQIMETNGGRIGFNSKPRDGTTFYIELPAIRFEIPK